MSGELRLLLVLGAVSIIPITLIAMLVFARRLRASGAVPDFHPDALVFEERFVGGRLDQRGTIPIPTIGGGLWVQVTPIEVWIRPLGPFVIAGERLVRCIPRGSLIGVRQKRHVVTISWRTPQTGLRAVALRLRDADGFVAVLREAGDLGDDPVREPG